MWHNMVLIVIFLRLMFGKVQYGWLPNRKIKSIGKTDRYAWINFIKGVNDVSTKNRDRAQLLHAILVHMTNGGQDHTQTIIALLLKSNSN